MNWSLRLGRWLLVLCVAGAGLGCTEQSVPEMTTLRVAFNGSTDSVRPGFLQTRYSSALVLATYDTLLEYRYLSRPLELAPSLAAAMPEVSADGRTVTVRLKPGIRFSDDPVFPDGNGRVVTADDVAYSVLRHFDPAIAARRSDLWRDLISGIKDWQGDYDHPPAGIQVLDELTIQFQLTARSPKFLHTLANPASAIVPREAEAAYGEELARRTVGTGPYQLASLDETGAVLIRNPNYRERRFSLEEAGFDPTRHDPRIADLEGRLLPLLDRVEVSFISDMTSRWLAFSNGELDIVPLNEKALTGLLQSGSNTQLQLEHAKRFTLHVSAGNEVILIRVKMDDKTLGLHPDRETNQRNAELRCAIRDSLNWSDRNAAFFEGRALEFQGVVAPALPEYRDVTRPVRSAASLGASFQAEDLPIITYGFTSGATNQNNYEQFRSHLIAAGFPADKIQPVRYSSFGEFLNGTRSGKHLVSNISWTLNYPDAENNLQLFYGPNSDPGVNLGNYRSERFDELFKRVNQTAPSPERTALVEDMNALLWEDCAYFGSLSPRGLLMSQKQVIGMPDHTSTIVGRHYAFLSKVSFVQ